jgi:hypothetical protein
MKVILFWDFAPCVHRPDDGGINISERSVSFYEAVLCNSLEGSLPCACRRENLKLHTLGFIERCILLQLK